MQFTRRKLKNGVTLLVEKRDLPVVSCSISMPFGGAFEVVSEKGIAHFIEHLLFTGTLTRSHEDISKEIEKKGGILNAFTAHEITSYYFKLPSVHLFAGLDIITDMLKNPAFKIEKFEKEKKVILEEIKMYHDSPARHIHDVLERNLYGDPFGLNIIGTPETVSSLSREFVVNYFTEHYDPGQFVVTAVGDVDVEKLVTYLEGRFAATPVHNVVQTLVLTAGRTVEERPGLDQAHFMLGMHAPALGTKDYYVLEVLDAYLAHGMSSRLFLTIREEKGLAYSVKSSLSAEKSYSYYSIYVGTRKDAVTQVEELIVQGFNDIVQMSEQDLQLAKEQLIGLHAVAREESSGVMNELVFAEFAGKAEDYYEREGKIRSVTLDEVKVLAQKLIRGTYSTAAIVPQ
ncbi:insulinase family protein [Candidatus Pacearchaeota archaeon]|nr:insulinase family protein [Candidatus Pacearchaeota archaeon]